MASHPLLKTALEGLDLDLERELKRYRNHLGSEDSKLPIEVSRESARELTGANQDFEFAFDSLSEVSLDEVTLSEPILDRGTQDTGLSELDDLALEWESTLDEEFQGQLQAVDFEPEFSQQYKQESTPLNIAIPSDRLPPKESSPNLLSPLGVIAMILLLISSATVGYLLVDSSGLYRLIRQEDKPKPVNLSEDIKLFQTEGADIEQIPFVDFTNTKNKSNKSNKLNELPQLPPPIGLGRSFEAPIRVEPEIKLESQPIAPKIVKSNSQPSKPKKIDKKPSLELDPEPTLENPSSLNTARSPLSISKPVPTPITPNQVRANTPSESPKPQLNSNEVKIEVKPEVIQESD
jgi:hypothetical protein